MSWRFMLRGLLHQSASKKAEQHSSVEVSYRFERVVDCTYLIEGRSDCQSYSRYSRSAGTVSGYRLLHPYGTGTYVHTYPSVAHELMSCEL